MRSPERTEERGMGCCMCEFAGILRKTNQRLIVVTLGLNQIHIISPYGNFLYNQPWECWLIYLDKGMP